MSKTETIGDFAKRYPMFYSPVVLLGMLFVGYGVISIAEAVPILWVKLPIMVVGLLIELAALVLAVVLLWTLGMALQEDSAALLPPQRLRDKKAPDATPNSERES